MSKWSEWADKWHAWWAKPVVGISTAPAAIHSLYDATPSEVPSVESSDLGDAKPVEIIFWKDDLLGVKWDEKGNAIVLLDSPTQLASGELTPSEAVNEESAALEAETFDRGQALAAWEIELLEESDAKKLELPPALFQELYAVTCGEHGADCGVRDYRKPSHVKSALTQLNHPSPRVWRAQITWVEVTREFVND